MNRENKIQLIMEDERNRIREQELTLQREEHKLHELDTLLDSPGLPDERIEDDFQTATVPITDVQQRVFYYEVPNNRAAIIEYIGNDWYPGLTYEFIVDNHSILEGTQREIAPTENPKNVHIICTDKITWVATNTNGDVDAEERDVGIVTGGRLVPEKAYNLYTDLYDEYDTEYAELVEIPSSVEG